MEYSYCCTVTNALLSVVWFGILLLYYQSPLTTGDSSRFPRISCLRAHARVLAKKIKTASGYCLYIPQTLFVYERKHGYY